jgi:glycosyltransferase involved in cell wall biosynthesis
MKKKICIITTVHNLFDNRIFFKQAGTLAERYDVVLIAQGKSHTAGKIRVVGLKKPRNRFDRFLKTNKQAYEKAAREQAEIYHFHDPEFLFFTRKLKKKTKGKIIYDVHEDVERQILNKPWIPVFLRKIISRIFKITENFFIRHVDFIIVSEDPYLGIYRKYRNVDAVRNFPFYVKTGKKKKKTLVYLGSVSEERGLFKMIEALKIVKKNHSDIKLEIIGGIEEKMRERAEKIIYGYGLEKNIRFHGFVKSDEAMKIAEKCFIGLSLLQPTQHYLNNWPSKLFDYMMLGIPIIISDFKITQKIIEDTECGLVVDSTNPEEIAEKIEFLIENPKIAEKLGKNGRKHALKKYNWGRERKKLLRIYEELLK